MIYIICIIWSAITYLKNNLILCFLDKDVGINDKDLPNIFTAFYRGISKDSIYGNGIGLSLTQRIISMHNGSIQVFSKVNEGSSFVIEIPHL